MRKTILLLALILLVPSAVLAQALRTITGVVTDEAGEPVIAATVYIEETNKAVYTDANGHYTIQAQDGQTVIFSFIGFERQSRKVKGDATINIIMKEDENTRLADVVVVGYSTMERRDLTGSVSSVKLPEDKPFLSIDQMLAGQAPGVFVNTSSGNLGSANLMTIRGISSILGDNNPLYVILVGIASAAPLLLLTASQILSIIVVIVMFIIGFIFWALCWIAMGDRGMSKCKAYKAYFEKKKAVAHCRAVKAGKALPAGKDAPAAPATGASAPAPKKKAQPAPYQNPKKKKKKK